MSKQSFRINEIIRKSKMTSKRILICGHRAFAARGLNDLLAAAGHQVTQFSRGEMIRAKDAITGDVCHIHENPLFEGDCDVVINFIILRNKSIDQNLTYLESLLRFCMEKKVKHLIHFSSMSVYPDSVEIYTEHTRMKTDPAACGVYAAIKVASDFFLMKHVPPRLKLTLVRPGYIIGNDMKNAIGSTAIRISSRYLIPLGRCDRRRPLISRSVMHRAIRRIIEVPSHEAQEILLLVDPDSPSVLDYLHACCENGFASKVIPLPVFIWAPLFLIKEIRKTFPHRFLIRRFANSLIARTKNQQYNPAQTEKRLGMSLHSDWQAELGA